MTNKRRKDVGKGKVVKSVYVSLPTFSSLADIKISFKNSYQKGSESFDAAACFWMGSARKFLFISEELCHSKTSNERLSSSFILQSSARKITCLFVVGGELKLEGAF